MAFRIYLFFIILFSSAFTDSHIVFTKEEKAYLSTNPIITIGSMNAHPPFSFMHDGKKIGYTHDLLKLIEQRSGLHFHKVHGTWPQMFQSFKDAKIDIIAEFSYKKERTPYTLYTDSYFNIPIGVFARSDFGIYSGIESLKGKKVGIVKGSYLLSIVKGIKEVEVVEIDSADERFYALSAKKVDVVLSNAMSLYRVESMLFSDIDLVGYFKYKGVQSEDLRFGIRKENPLLASIMQKSLNSIDFAQLNELKKEWIGNLSKQTIHTLNSKEKAWIEQNLVSIGIESAAPYITFDSLNNSPQGLYADILKLIIEKTGLKVEYKSQSWSALLDSFKKKQLDILPATFYTPSRESFGLYSKPYYNVREYIYTLKNNDAIIDMPSLENKTVAIVQGYATIEKIKAQFPSIKIIQTKSLSESIAMIETKQADALIDYHLVVEEYLRNNDIISLKAVAQKVFKPTSVHLFSQIDKPILQSILQKGLDAISREEKNNILRNWLGEVDEKEDANALTIDEETFLAKHPVIRFRVRSQRPPFEFNNNGVADGIAVDYVKKAALNVGLKAEFVLNDDPVSVAYAQMNADRTNYDTVLFSVKSEERLKLYSYGDAYLSYPLMIISHNEAPYIGRLKDLEGKTIVLEEGFLTNKWIKRDYPNINIINVKSTKEALQMVNDKKILAYVGNLGVANHMSLFENMKHLKISAPSGYKDINYNFIAPKAWPELASLLNKGYRQITPTEHSSIQQKWFSLQTIEKVDYTLIWEILAACVLLVLWFVWWNRKLASERNKTQEALRQLQVSQEEQLRQQQVLLNQSKIAAMGEMIGNIAHQWRQPLSVISITATGMKLKKELGPLDDKEFENNMDIINTNAQYLSKTIDTFRNFIKEKKEYKEVILQDRIHIALDIFGTSLKNQGIELITNVDEVEPIKIHLVLGELSQVIGNIIHNAKDALLERKVRKPWIKIMIESCSKNLVILSIEDNAGGIDEKIHSKIFEPYFTTKHQSQGTGLGLHMSYKIIVESLHGKLYVQNSIHGAKFFIELPLNIKPL